MRSGAILLGVVCIVAGCSAGSTTFRTAASPGISNDRSAVPAFVSPPRLTRVEKQTAPENDCEVRLFLEQVSGQGIDRNTELGAVIAERTDGKAVVNGVCIKRVGERLQLPASMLIVTDEHGPDLQRFCTDGDRMNLQMHVPQTAKQAATAIDVKGCTWNGRFHAARPFTITLLTTSNHSLGEYVELLRVYRNSDLMAAWNRVSDQPERNKLEIPGSSLTTGLFALTHPPHLSPMDIRVTPRDDSVVQTVELETRDDRKRFELAWKKAGSSALDVLLPPTSPERASFNCLTSHIKSSAAKAKKIVNGSVVVFDPACSVLTGQSQPAGGPPAAATPLSDEYVDIKHQSREKLDEIRAQAIGDIDDLKKQFWQQIPERHRELVEALLNAAFKKILGKVDPTMAKAIAACKAEIVDHDPNANCKGALLALSPALALEYERLVKVAHAVDKNVEIALANLDEARALADRLNDKAKDIVSNPKKQAEIFNAFAESLATHGDPFEPRRDNPPLLIGEQKIDLEYSDKWQSFMFAPWNGVPIKTSDGASTDLSALVAVPLLDVAGVRYQWAKSRFADARLAAGFGFAETDVPAEQTKVVTPLPNVSFGLGTVKVGVGYATAKGLGDTGDRIRVLIGADLFKLIGGNNVEAL